MCPSLWGYSGTNVHSLVWSPLCCHVVSRGSFLGEVSFYGGLLADESGKAFCPLVAKNSTLLTEKSVESHRMPRKYRRSCFADRDAAWQPSHAIYLSGNHDTERNAARLSGATIDLGVGADGFGLHLQAFPTKEEGGAADSLMQRTGGIIKAPVQNQVPI